MSTEKIAPPKPISSLDVAWEEWSEVPRFGVRYRHLTRAAVGEGYRVGVAIEELRPGKQSTPAHYHIFEEPAPASSSLTMLTSWRKAISHTIAQWAVRQRFAALCLLANGSFGVLQDGWDKSLGKSSEEAPNDEKSQIFTRKNEMEPGEIGRIGYLSN